MKYFSPYRIGKEIDRSCMAAGRSCVATSNGRTCRGDQDKWGCAGRTQKPLWRRWKSTGRSGLRSIGVIH